MIVRLLVPLFGLTIEGLKENCNEAFDVELVFNIELILDLIWKSMTGASVSKVKVTFVPFVPVLLKASIQLTVQLWRPSFKAVVTR